MSIFSTDVSVWCALLTSKLEANHFINLSFHYEADNTTKQKKNDLQVM
jgi:hypothetical protein